jgi:hypothetical protein
MFGSSHILEPTAYSSADKLEPQCLSVHRTFDELCRCIEHRANATTPLQEFELQPLWGAQEIRKKALYFQGVIIGHSQRVAGR